MKGRILLLVFILLFTTLIIGFIFIYQKAGGSISQIFPDKIIDEAEIATLYSKINQYRKSKGLKFLEINSKLETSAKNKALDMVAKNYWGYEGPGNQPPWKFFIEAGYNYLYAGEDIGLNASRPEEILSQWKANKNHNDLLLGDRFEEAGLGYLCHITIGDNKDTCVVVLHLATKKISQESIPTNAAIDQTGPSIAIVAPTPATPPISSLTHEAVKAQLENSAAAKKSWETTARQVDPDEKKKLIDLLNRQIDYCKTILSRIENGKAPSTSDYDLWTAVVKMSYESYELAQKLNKVDPD